MRSATTFLLALFPLATLTGCPVCLDGECETEPEDRPVALVEGDWLFTMRVIETMGDCGAVDTPDAGGADRRDGEGSTFFARIATPGARTIAIDIDGLRLRGERWADQVSASGELVERPEPPDEPIQSESEDDEPAREDEGSDDSSGAEGKCEVEEPAPDDSGSRVDLVATVLAPARMVGELLVELHEPGMDCTIAMDFDAHLADDCVEDGPEHLGDCGGETVPVEVEIEGGCDDGDVDCG